MKRLLVSWAILAVTVALTAALVPGIDITGGVGSWFIIALVFSVVDVAFGGKLKLLTLPLILMTLGVLAFFINAAMLLVTAWLMDTLDVDGLGPALVGALCITVINAILHAVLLRDRTADSRR